MVAPKLRFQEFDGDWESKKLKDLTDILKCGVASTPKYVTEGGYPFLSAQNISRNGEMNYSKVNNISDDFYKKISKTKLLKGDILYSRVGASYGVAAIFDREEEYGVYVSLTHIRVNDTLNNIFLKQFLNSPKARIQAEQGVFQGGGVQNLNVGVVEEFNLTLPSKQEQTKIASFLAAVDEKITQLTQKHQLLSQYKQGMMQKLFSQQIRFKADDGSEFAEWESKTLGEIIKFVNGKGHENDVDSDGSYTLINSKFLSTDGNVAKKVNKCNQKVMNDSLVMVMSDVPNGKALAKVMYIEDGSKFALNQRIGMFIFYKDHYPKFFQYQLNRHQYYLAFDSGVGQTNLKKENVLNCPILVPCIEEQTKIANFLSAIDQKIEVVAQQIEQAKLWKKGLLQQMFV